MTHAPLLVIDLDGTYIKGNTLRIFLGVLLKRQIRGMNFIDALRTVGWMALRAARLVSHARMKFAILENVDFQDHKLRSDFSRAILRRVNPAVKAMVDEQIAAGGKVLIATAAPREYVGWITPLPHVATPITNNPGRMECRGEIKLKAVEAYMAKHNLETAIHIVTDHHDDLPLIMAAKSVTLVNPSPTTAMIVSAAGVRYNQL